MEGVRGSALVYDTYRIGRALSTLGRSVGRVQEEEQESLGATEAVSLSVADAVDHKGVAASTTRVDHKLEGSVYERDLKKVRAVVVD